MSQCPGQAGTQMKIRAGAVFGKKRASIAFTAANVSTGVQYTLHLITFSSNEPAVSTHSLSCSGTNSVCRTIDSARRRRRRSGVVRSNLRHRDQREVEEQGR